MKVPFYLLVEWCAPYHTLDCNKTSTIVNQNVTTWNKLWYMYNTHLCCFQYIYSEGSWHISKIDCREQLGSIRNSCQSTACDVLMCKTWRAMVIDMIYYTYTEYRRNTIVRIYSGGNVWRIQWWSENMIKYTNNCWFSSRRHALKYKMHWKYADRSDIYQQWE